MLCDTAGNPLTVPSFAINDGALSVTVGPRIFQATSGREYISQSENYLGNVQLFRWFADGTANVLGGFPDIGGTPPPDNNYVVEASTILFALAGP
jgi:hypothetical protein